VRVFAGVHELEKATGEHLGWSNWHVVTQERVDRFAEATGDGQWIHVDVERAKQGPFGGTIAHGFLTLSLIPTFALEIYRIDGLAMALNYGLDKVRFPGTVPVGSSVRAGAEVVEVAGTPNGVRAVVRMTVECEGVEKPVCVADSVVLLIPGEPETPEEDDRNVAVR
jgi:acyl dehydratase